MNCVHLIWAIDVTSEAVDCGRHPEDGESMIGDVWFVRATCNTCGTRYAHRHQFDGQLPCRDCILAQLDSEGRIPLCKHHVNASRRNGSKAAHRLAQRVFLAERTWTPVNNPHWVASQPVYGSDAYVASDCE